MKLIVSIMAVTRKLGYLKAFKIFEIEHELVQFIVAVYSSLLNRVSLSQLAPKMRHHGIWCVSMESVCSNTVSKTQSLGHIRNAAAFENLTKN